MENRITKIDQVGIDHIIECEGLKLKPYLDSAKIPTIGIGATYYPNGKRVTMKDPAITKQQAIDMLYIMIDQYQKTVDSVTRDDINQNQFNALVDFAYNAGVNAFKASTLLKKVNINPNDPTIADEFRKWVYAGDGTRNKVDDDKDGLIDEAGEKQRVKGLENRREKQINLYFKK